MPRYFKNGMETTELKDVLVQKNLWESTVIFSPWYAISTRFLKRPLWLARCLHHEPGILWTRWSFVWEAHSPGPDLPTFPMAWGGLATKALKSSVTSHRASCLWGALLSEARGTHVHTCNARPGWCWRSWDNPSSCQSGRKCSFTTMRPGAIIYYAFRQWEPCQLQHSAAVAAIRHHSPIQPFVPRSLQWIITGGQHIFQESLSCWVWALTLPRLFKPAALAPRPHDLQAGDSVAWRTSLSPVLRMAGKQSVCTILQGRMKNHATLLPINVGYCILLHSVMSQEACCDIKLHYSALNRPSLSALNLALLLGDEQITFKVTDGSIRGWHF